MSVAFVQATREDILSVEPQPAQGGAESLRYGKEMIALGQVPLQGQAMAALEDDRCLGAYGWIRLWHGTARAWGLFSSELLKKYPLILAKHVRTDLEREEQASDLHRIEATVAKGHNAGIEFLEWLGFEQEGLMRRYSPDGTDSYLFARVRYVF